MIYKPNMRGSVDDSCENTNNLVVDYRKEIERDYIIITRKEKTNGILEIRPRYYVCPECGLVLQKIPKEDINDVINAEW